RGEGLSTSNEIAAFSVSRFREKPDAKTADEYLQSGDFYWNSGIFLWSAKTILEAIKSRQPEMYDRIDTIAQSIGTGDYAATLEREFCAIEGTSIDYAVMESYPNVLVIEAPFSWDDVGSWQSLSRLHAADADGNTVVGNHVGIDTSGSIVFGSANHTVVTIGVEDLIVVQTEDATLVAPKAAEERVREAVSRLKELGRSDVL
ncbi:MAG: sugar phosphate nucleotidyltransferase, partial [Planctomycetota bacterium]